MHKTSTKQLTLTAIFLVIIIVLGVTPLGFIHLGFIKATIIHVPVIIASIVLGPYIGAFLGLMFGILSIITNTLTPSLLSFAFSPLIPVIGTTHGSLWALIIALVPRILVGVVPYYVATLLRIENQKIKLAIAAFIGSMTNTLLVMGFIALLFSDAYAQARNIGYDAVNKTIITVIALNGIPEALVATALVVPVVIALDKVRKRTY